MEWTTIAFTLADTEIDLGWLAFAKVGHWLAEFDLTADRLVYQWHDSESFGVTTTFEVTP